MKHLKKIIHYIAAFFMLIGMIIKHGSLEEAHRQAIKKLNKARMDAWKKGIKIDG